MVKRSDFGTHSEQSLASMILILVLQKGTQKVKWILNPGGHLLPSDCQVVFHLPSFPCILKKKKKKILYQLPQRSGRLKSHHHGFLGLVCRKTPLLAIKTTWLLLWCFFVNHFTFGPNIVLMSDLNVVAMEEEQVIHK